MDKKMIAVLALGAACLSAQAGPTMYRCGSTFQDRPCESAAEQQTIRPGRGAGHAVVPSAAAPAASTAAAAAASPASAQPAEKAARAASAASAPRPASAKESSPSTPSAVSTAVPGASTTRTATGNTHADCGNVRTKGTTLNVGKPANLKATEAGC
jgi:hypothetical protein